MVGDTITVWKGVPKQHQPGGSSANRPPLLTLPSTPLIPTSNTPPCISKPTTQYRGGERLKSIKHIYLHALSEASCTGAPV